MTSRTRAVIPVHYAGGPADMRGVSRVGAAPRPDGDRRRRACVETVAAGEKIGTTADFTCFSFYATKNLTTGEGGMLTTASEKAAAFARTAALHGMSRDAWQRYAPGGSPHYDVVMPGFKYNMMDLQAAIGLRQLARSRMHARREAVWQIYDEGLADLPLTLPAPVAASDVHARHLYTVLVGDDAGVTRDQLIERLRAQGIATSVHFRAVHLHSYYAHRFGLVRGMFPNAERVSDHVVSLPLWGGMSNDAAWTVVGAIRAALAPARSAA